MYVCQLSLLQLLIWAGYRHFKKRLPEAIFVVYKLVMLMLCCW